MREIRANALAGNDRADLYRWVPHPPLRGVFGMTGLLIVPRHNQLQFFSGPFPAIA